MLRKVTLGLLTLWVAVATDVTLPVTSTWLRFFPNGKPSLVSFATIPTAYAAPAADCITASQLQTEATTATQKVTDFQTKVNDFLQNSNKPGYIKRSNAAIAAGQAAWTELNSFQTMLRTFASKDCGLDAFNAAKETLVRQAPLYNQVRASVPSETAIAQNTQDFTMSDVSYTTLSTSSSGTCSNLMDSIDQKVAVAEPKITSAEDLLLLNENERKALNINTVKQKLDDARQALLAANQALRAAQTAGCDKDATFAARYKAQHDRVFGMLQKLNQVESEFGQEQTSLGETLSRTFSNIDEQCGCNAYDSEASLTSSIGRAVMEGFKALLGTLFSPMCYLSCGVLLAMVAFLEQTALPALQGAFGDSSSSSQTQTGNGTGSGSGVGGVGIDPNAGTAPGTGSGVGVGIDPNAGTANGSSARPGSGTPTGASGGTSTGAAVGAGAGSNP